MHWFRVIALTILAALLQVSLLGALRIGGVVPNIVLVLLVSIVIWGTASEALLSSVIAGLILDFLGAGSFGLALSSLVVITLGLIALRQLGVDGRIWPIRFGMVVVATIAWWLIHITSLGVSNFGLVATWRIVCIEIIVNGLLALVFTERMVHGTHKV